MQSLPDFETLFHEACTATGPAYIAVRDGVLAVPWDTSVKARMQAAKASPAPAQAMTAGILLLRMTRLEDVRQAEENLDGKYPKLPWQQMMVNNDWPEWRMQSANKHLGDDLIFLALEILFKSHEYSNARSRKWGACMLTIKAAADPRWNDMLLSIVSDASYNSGTRYTVGSFLLQKMKDQRLLPFFRDFLHQKPVDSNWAIFALNQLAEAHDQSSVPRMKAIALDLKEDESVRSHALDALVEMKEPDAQDILLKALTTAKKGSHMLLIIAGGLSQIGDRRAVPALKRIERLLEGEDSAQAASYLEDLNDRLAGKPRKGQTP
jgi:hypothetical protein